MNTRLRVDSTGTPHKSLIPSSAPPRRPPTCPRPRQWTDHSRQPSGLDGEDGDSSSRPNPSTLWSRSFSNSHSPTHHSSGPVGREVDHTGRGSLLRQPPNIVLLDPDVDDDGRSQARELEVVTVTPNETNLSASGDRLSDTVDTTTEELSRDTGDPEQASADAGDTGDPEQANADASDTDDPKQASADASDTSDPEQASADANENLESVVHTSNVELRMEEELRARQSHPDKNRIEREAALHLQQPDNSVGRQQDMPDNSIARPQNLVEEVPAAGNLLLGNEIPLPTNDLDMASTDHSFQQNEFSSGLTSPSPDQAPVLPAKPAVEMPGGGDVVPVLAVTTDTTAGGVAGGEGVSVLPHTPDIAMAAGASVPLTPDNTTVGVAGGEGSFVLHPTPHNTVIEMAGASVPPLNTVPGGEGAVLPPNTTTIGMDGGGGEGTPVISLNTADIVAGGGEEAPLYTAVVGHGSTPGVASSTGEASVLPLPPDSDTANGVAGSGKKANEEELSTSDLIQVAVPQHSDTPSAHGQKQPSTLPDSLPASPPPELAESPLERKSSAENDITVDEFDIPATSGLAGSSDGLAIPYAASILSGHSTATLDHDNLSISARGSKSSSIPAKYPVQSSELSPEGVFHAYSMPPPVRSHVLGEGHHVIQSNATATPDGGEGVVIGSKARAGGSVDPEERLQPFSMASKVIVVDSLEEYHQVMESYKQREMEEVESANNLSADEEDEELEEGHGVGETSSRDEVFEEVRFKIGGGGGGGGDGEGEEGSVELGLQSYQPVVRSECSEDLNVESSSLPSNPSPKDHIIDAPTTPLTVNIPLIKQLSGVVIGDTLKLSPNEALQSSVLHHQSSEVSNDPSSEESSSVLFRPKKPKKPKKRREHRQSVRLSESETEEGIVTRLPPPVGFEMKASKTRLLANPETTATLANPPSVEGTSSQANPPSIEVTSSLANPPSVEVTSSVGIPPSVDNSLVTSSMASQLGLPLGVEVLTPSQVTTTTTGTSDEGGSAGGGGGGVRPRTGATRLGKANLSLVFPVLPPCSIMEHFSKKDEEGFLPENYAEVGAEVVVAIIKQKVVMTGID